MKTPSKQTAQIEITERYNKDGNLTSMTFLAWSEAKGLYPVARIEIFGSSGYSVITDNGKCATFTAAPTREENLNAATAAAIAAIRTYPELWESQTNTY